VTDGNGTPGAPAPPASEAMRLVGSLYVEFLGNDRGQLVTRMLGHIPDGASVAAAQALDEIARNLRARGSKIILPGLPR